MIFLISEPSPVWFAFGSGIVFGAFVTLVSVAIFMMYVARASGRKAAED